MIELGPLYLFVFLGLFTPGPNVILLVSSGIRFGFKPTIPHILGVAFGVGITAAATGFGLGVVIAQLPMVKPVLSVLAAGWICFMAYKLWISPHPAHNPQGRPFTFVQAVLFQWVNPKIWAVAFVAMAYVPDDFVPLYGAFALGHAFAGINLFVCTFWTGFGFALSRVLTQPTVYAGFMRGMALLLLLSVVLIFI